MDGSVQVHQATQGDPEQETDTQEAVHWKLIPDSCTEHQARMKEIEDYLRSNIHENIKITDLSKKAHVPMSTPATWKKEIRESVEKERRSAAGFSEYCSQPVGYYPPQLSGTFLLTGQDTAPASQVLVQAQHLPETWAQSCPVQQVRVLSTQHRYRLNASVHFQGASLAAREGVHSCPCCLGRQRPVGLKFYLLYFYPAPRQHRARAQRSPALCSRARSPASSRAVHPRAAYPVAGLGRPASPPRDFARLACHSRC